MVFRWLKILRYERRERLAWKMADMLGDLKLQDISNPTHPRCWLWPSTIATAGEATNDFLPHWQGTRYLGRNADVPWLHLTCLAIEGSCTVLLIRFLGLLETIHNTVLCFHTFIIHYNGPWKGRPWRSSSDAMHSPGDFLASEICC